MNTDSKPEDGGMFGGSASPFGAAADSPFGGSGMSFGEVAAEAFGSDAAKDFWDMVSEDAADTDPEVVAKRVFNEVEQAFRDRAAAEQKRMEEAVDSEFWISLVFQTRGQKDQFLQKIGLDTAAMGDKYLDGPTVAALVGRPVDPVRVRYNNSSKLDRRLEDMARDPDELPGLGGSHQPTGA